MDETELASLTPEMRSLYARRTKIISQLRGVLNKGDPEDGYAAVIAVLGGFIHISCSNQKEDVAFLFSTIQELTKGVAILRSRAEDAEQEEDADDEESLSPLRTAH